MAFKVTFQSDVRGAQRKMRNWGSEIVSEIAHQYTEDLKTTLSVPPARSGRRYVIDGQLHTASAKGEPPAPLTGALRASITPVQARSSDRKVEYAVMSDMDYAVDLELGIGSMLEHGERPAWINTLFEKLASYQSIVRRG